MILTSDNSIVRFTYDISGRSKLFDFQTDNQSKDMNKLHYLRKIIRDSMKQSGDISELHFTEQKCLNPTI